MTTVIFTDILTGLLRVILCFCHEILRSAQNDLTPLSELCPPSPVWATEG